MCRPNYKTVIGFLAILVSCTLVPLLAHAQTGALEGRVVDAQSQSPIPGANVKVEADGGEVFGDAVSQNGRFTLNEIPAGTHEIIASFVGYQTVQREVRVRENRTTEIEIELSEEAVQAGEVTVTARRQYASDVSTSGLKFAAPVQDVPRGIQVITEDFLEDQEADRLDEVFRNASGVNAFSVYQDFTIRGFRSFQVLYNGVKASGYDSFVNPKMTNVERVEVLKGPASVLYGQIEPGGMINIVTKDPQAESMQRFSVTGGSYSRIQASTDLTGDFGSGGDVMYRLTGRLENRESYRQFQEFTNFQVAPAVTWVPGSSTIITLKGSYFQEDTNGRRNRGIAAPNGNLDALPVEWTANEEGDYADSYGATAELSLEHAFSDSWRTKNTIRVAQGTYDEAYHEPRGLGERNGRILVGRQYRDSKFDHESYTVNANLIGDVKTGPVEHKLVVGGDFVTGGRDTDARWATGGVAPLDVMDPEYGNVDLDSYEYGTVFNIDIDEQELGLYAQDLVTVVPGLKVLGGVRFDNFDANQTRVVNGDETNPDTDNQALTYQGGVVYQPLQKVSLYASYSEGFKPQAANLQSFGGPFDPEESWQVEGGSKFSFLDGRLNTTLAAYRIVKQNVLVRDPDSETFQYTQAGEVVSQGFEADVIGSIMRNWSLVANYSYNFTEISEHSDPEQQGLSLPNAPEHAAALWTRYDILPINLGIGAGFSFVGERRVPDNTELPSYTLVDAALYYQWGNVELSLNVKNVFDQRHFIGGINQVALFPGTPRSFSLGASVEL